MKILSCVQVLHQQNRSRGTLLLWYIVGNAWVSSLCVSLADDVDKGSETPQAWFQCFEKTKDCQQ